MFNYHVGTSLGDIAYKTCGTPCLNKLRGNVLDDKLSNNINMVKGFRKQVFTTHKTLYIIICGLIEYSIIIKFNNRGGTSTWIHVTEAGKFFVEMYEPSCYTKNLHLSLS